MNYKTVNKDDILIDRKTNQRMQVLKICIRNPKCDNTYEVLALNNTLLFQKGGIYLIGEFALHNYDLDVSYKLNKLISTL